MMDYFDLVDLFRIKYNDINNNAGYTYIPKNNRHSRIDYLLVSSHIITDIMSTDMKANMQFTDINIIPYGESDSDHCALDWKITAQPKPKLMKKIEL